MDKQRSRYRIKNWNEYNKSLVQRGSLTLWIEDSFEQDCKATNPANKRGRPFFYSDLMIELCLIFNIRYRLSYRETQGFVASVLSLKGLNLEVPSYTQLHRRAKKITIPLRRYLDHSGNIDLVIDSTGLKVYGEGEWKVRQHGVSKRRTWKKLHLGVDPISHEVRAFTLTGNNVHDSSMLEGLIEQVDAPIDRCFADGAYDCQSCYKACDTRGIMLIAPPNINAVMRKSKGSDQHLKQRYKSLERIQELTQEGGDLYEARKRWKQESDYHVRSLAETAMFRFKTLWGSTLFSRIESTSQVEIALKVNMMNKLSSLGMPLSSLVAC